MTVNQRFHIWDSECEKWRRQEDRKWGKQALAISGEDAPAKMLQLGSMLKHETTQTEIGQSLHFTPGNPPSHVEEEKEIPSLTLLKN